MSGQKSYWDRVAWVYDAFERTNGRAIDRLRAAICAEVRGAERVLEAAAGTGLISAAMADVAGEVFCTDSAPKMLAQAGKRMARRGLDAVRIQREDIFHLSFPDGWFDAVVAAHVLHIIPRPELAVAELKRVLKPGGKLILPLFLTAEAGAAGRLSLGLIQRMGYRAHNEWGAPAYRVFLERCGLTLCHFEVIPGTMPIAFPVAVRV